MIPQEPAEAGIAACADPTKSPEFATVPRTIQQQYEKYYVNLDEAPADLDPNEVLANINSGFLSWNDEFNDCLRPDTSDFLFQQVAVTNQYTGLCAGSPVADGVNIVSFESLTALGWSPTTVALACIRKTVDPAAWDSIIEFDIALSTDYSYGTVSQPRDLDIWNVMTHEAGHVVGLGHVSTETCPPAGQVHKFLTMYACVWPGDTYKRTLGLGDMLGLEEAVAHRPQE